MPRKFFTSHRRSGRRTGEVFDAIRALFRRGDQGRQRIDVNEIIVEVLRSLRGELRDHEVETRPKLTELPLVDGHRVEILCRRGGQGDTVSV